MPTLAQPEHTIRLLEEYPQRQESILREAVNFSSAPATTRMAAYLLLGESEAANALIDSVSDEDPTLVDGSIWLRILYTPETNANLSDENRRRIESLLRDFIENDAVFTTPEPTAPLLSESHNLLKLSILFLWALYQSDLQETANSFNDVIQELQNDIHDWMDKRGRFGFDEQGSAYYLHMLAGLLNLSDFSPEPTLRVKSAAIIDLIVADIAQSSIGGLWGGPRQRTLEAVAPIPGNRMFYIFFGQTLAREHDLMIDPASIHLAASNYRPPAALTRLGLQWQERDIIENKIRFTRTPGKPNPQGLGRKYAYVTPQFILGSFSLRDEEVPWQSRPWDLLVWDGEHAHNHIFAFNGRQLFSGGRPPYAAEHFHWNATVIQHRNVLFCRFHRSDRKRADRDPALPLDRRYAQQPTRIWFPDVFHPVEEGGDWWFCRMGEVYIALRPLDGGGYWWRTVQTRTPATREASILTLQNLESGFILEVDLASRFTSFERFKQQVQEAPLVVEPDSVTFVSRRGDVILFPLDNSDFLVNGRSIDPSGDPEYQLFSNRYIASEYGSGLFEANWPPFSHWLDFSDPNNPIRRMEQPVINNGR